MLVEITLKEVSPFSTGVKYGYFIIYYWFKFLLHIFFF